MNNRQKEQYIREYYILKGQQGKPFFPYTVFKDGAMPCVVLLVIIAMSIILGAELGPMAGPAAPSYIPRRECSRFFLFGLLRVAKPPLLVFLATVGIPPICMVRLILLPFIDGNPEGRPIRRPLAPT